MVSSIRVLLCSHRKEGTNKQIRDCLEQHGARQNDIVSFADLNLRPCIQCARCTGGFCEQYGQDGFNDLLTTLMNARALLLISPLYSPLPSQLAAFLERLTSVTYFSEPCGIVPLRGKKCAVLGYDSRERNVEVEGTIKKILKPNFNGYSQAAPQGDDTFVEHTEQRNNRNILACVQALYAKLQAEIM